MPCVEVWSKEELGLGMLFPSPQAPAPVRVQLTDLLYRCAPLGKAQGLL